MNEDTTQDDQNVLRAAVIALVVGTAISVAAVLPAEYGLDPTGIGRALGLLQLSETAQSEPTPSLKPGPGKPGVNRTAATLRLMPGDGVEHKVSMLEGDRATFRWFASAIVHFDMHGEPAGDTNGYYESYALGNADGVEGKFTALFDGIHGWYWRNDSQEPVEIDLVVAGSFDLISMPQ